MIKCIIPAIITGLDSNIALAAQLPCTLIILRLNFWVEICVVPAHNIGKLADVEHIAQTAHIKVVIIQMFQLCRKTAAIRVVHLNHTTIRNSVEIVIVTVDEPNIFWHRFRLPNTPFVDAGCGNAFENFYAFKLDDLALIFRKYKQIPVPSSSHHVPAIRRQILFGNLPAFQRFARYLIISGKANTCAIFSEVQIAFIVDEVDRFI